MVSQRWLNESDIFFIFQESQYIAIKTWSSPIFHRGHVWLLPKAPWYAWYDNKTKIQVHRYNNICLRFSSSRYLQYSCHSQIHIKLPPNHLNFNFDFQRHNSNSKITNSILNLSQRRLLSLELLGRQTSHPAYIYSDHSVKI